MVLKIKKSSEGGPNLFLSHHPESSSDSLTFFACPSQQRPLMWDFSSITSRAYSSALLWVRDAQLPSFPPVQRTS